MVPAATRTGVRAVVPAATRTRRIPDIWILQNSDVRAKTLYGGAETSETRKQRRVKTIAMGRDCRYLPRPGDAVLEVGRLNPSSMQHSPGPVDKPTLSGQACGQVCVRVLCHRNPAGFTPGVCLWTGPFPFVLGQMDIAKFRRSANGFFHRSSYGFWNSCGIQAGT